MVHLCYQSSQRHSDDNFVLHDAQFNRMASNEKISDIYEVPRPEPAVEPELVSEPEKEEPFMDPEEPEEEDPEEDREEDRAILEYAADDVALAEEELEGDQRIPDQGMGAVLQALVKTVMDLMERNQQIPDQGMGAVEGLVKTVMDLMERNRQIPDQGMRAVEAMVKTVMDLMERNQQIANKVQELENKAQQLKDGNEEIKALWEAEIANRIRVEGVVAELRIKKRRLDRILDTYRTNL